MNNNSIHYDSEFCGRVPLHQTNLVQPHGVLLVVRRNDLQIIQASENATSIFGIPVQELAGKKLDQLISSGDAGRFVERFSEEVSERLPFLFHFTSGNFLAVIQPNPEYFIVEIELEKREEGRDNSFISVYEELKQAITKVETGKNTEETCYAAAAELKRISGFDKVMIYRFDPEWNGDVIAEVKEEGMDSYLGLKFPASDVPKQARELYKQTAYRLIPNVNYEPVRLYPVINPLTNAFTNLTSSNLRSVAGVHLEYLRNMKVVASMSTRILVDGKLWGLISCHHREAKYLTYEMCSIFELISGVVSAKLAALQKQEALSYKEQLQKQYTEIVEGMYREDRFPINEEQSGKLLRLLNADGAAIVMNHSIETIGNVPAAADIDEMVMWLSTVQPQALYHQPSLSAVYEPAEKYAEKASGLLSIPIKGESGNFILAFRPEEVQKVNWGGNPNEVVQMEPGTSNYHPRHSFGIWQQSVKQTSVPWKEEEIEIAEQFKNFLTGFLRNRIQ